MLFFFKKIVSFNYSEEVREKGGGEQTWDLHGKHLDQKLPEGPKVLILPGGNRDRFLWI